MNAVDRELTDMMAAVFARHREQHPPEKIATWDDGLWAQLSELGLTRLTGSADLGGSGAGWAEAAELLRAAATHGVRVPLAEHDLLACRLLEDAGLPVDDERRTVCLLDHTGTARGVPWAEEVDRVVTVWHHGGACLVADVPTAELRITHGVNSAGEPRDTVTADPHLLTGITVPGTAIERLWLRGALARGVQVCAALDRILDMSVTHAVERVQFGRPLAKFQAVQTLVADIAAQASLARAATEAAVAAAVRTDWSGEELDFLVAVARSCAGHATSVVVRNAHQVHGAMGATLEHRLHEFTGAALAWRSEFGSVRSWDDKLTTAAMAAARDGLWPLITT
ncbi:acyl-CoA dehydrogenase family protein [Nocardia ignorata]|uniref:Acyl-CoA dehydrogenase n=1 Tax=Nocardia ignorata TaxID=145285 RepID=A0A4R6PJE7_NOCIG|nr:acyl-CoA dehydrogenase family protein [Nocardia ignorata]TDP37810.1 acyl-CoA dehydrogenase [Nocardia ignorata]